MARYIDADIIKQELLEEDEKIGEPKDLKELLKSSGIFHALIHIQLAETEDVAPVVHAHWIDTLYGWACSNCEEEQEYTLYLGHCPHCGAKMDEVINDET